MEALSLSMTYWRTTASVPIEYTNAMASARVSIGKSSLPVRYAELAPADAKKKMTSQQAPPYRHGRVHQVA